MVANINPADNHSIHETRDSIDDDLDELIGRIKRNKEPPSHSKLTRKVSSRSTPRPLRQG